MIKRCIVKLLTANSILNLFPKQKSRIWTITWNLPCEEIQITLSCINNTTKPEKLIAEEILEVELKLKTETHKVSTSNVIVRKDKWSAKVWKLNKHLEELRRKYNFFLIDHSKFINIRHLNKSGIHLNKKGSTVLGESFLLNMLSVYSTDMIMNALKTNFLLQGTSLSLLQNMLQKLLQKFCA